MLKLNVKNKCDFIFSPLIFPTTIVEKVTHNRRDAQLVCHPHWEAFLELWSIHENANQTWSPLVPTNAVFVFFTGEPAVSRNSNASKVKVPLDCCFHLQDASPASKARFRQIENAVWSYVNYLLIKFRTYNTGLQWDLVFDHLSSLIGEKENCLKVWALLLPFIFIDSRIAWMTDSIWLGVVLVCLRSGVLWVYV